MLHNILEFHEESKNQRINGMYYEKNKYWVATPFGNT